MNPNTTHSKIASSRIILFWIMSLFLSATGSVKANSDLHWTLNDVFEEYMTIIAFVARDGSDLTGSQYEIGSFIDGECRGTVRLLEQTHQGHDYLCFLSVWGSTDDTGKEITLRLYNHAEDKVYEIEQKPLYAHIGILGLPELYELTLASTITNYHITIGNTSRGKVSSSANRAAEGDKIFLTVVPDTGYELDTISVYQTGTETKAVPVTGSDNTLAFFMPACDVTVNATFKRTQASLDAEAIAQVINRIEETPFNLLQKEGGTEREIKTYLTNRINQLLDGTGMTISVDDISITNFLAATAKTVDNPDGMDGSFDFRVVIHKGECSETTKILDGTIIAEVFTDLDAVAMDKLKVVQTPDGLRIEGCSPGETISLYDVRGNCLMRTKANHIELNITLQSRGIYIVTSEKQGNKVMF